MGSARYIGRVGALAVALGVGVAVANSPGVALAAPADGETSQSTSDTSKATDTEKSSGPTSDTPDNGSPDPETTGLSPRLDAETEEGEESAFHHFAESNLDAPAEFPEEEADLVEFDEPTGDEDPAPVDEETKVTPSIDIAASELGSWQPAVPAVPEVPQSSLAVERTLVAQVPTPVIDREASGLVINEPTGPLLRTFDAGALPQAVAPAQGASNPVVELLNLPGLLLRSAGIFVGNVVGAIFGPTSPTGDTPLLWAVLGWVRRLLWNETPEITPVLSAPDLYGNVLIVVPRVDGDGDVVRYSATNGTHGSVTLNADGHSFTYNPDDGYVGSDDFTITATDRGLHLHSLFGFLKPGGGHTAAKTVSVQAVALVPTVINSVPGSGLTSTGVVRSPDGKRGYQVVIDPGPLNNPNPHVRSVITTFDLGTGDVVGTALGFEGVAVTGVRFSTDGSRGYVIGLGDEIAGDGGPLDLENATTRVFVFDTQTGTAVGDALILDGFNLLGLSDILERNGRLFVGTTVEASGGARTTYFTTVDLSDGRLVNTVDFAGDSVYSAFFNASGSRLVKVTRTGADDSERTGVAVIDTATGELLNGGVDDIPGNTFTHGVARLSADGTRAFLTTDLRSDTQTTWLGVYDLGTGALLNGGAPIELSGLSYTGFGAFGLPSSRTIPIQFNDDGSRAFLLTMAGFDVTDPPDGNTKTWLAVVDTATGTLVGGSPIVVDGAPGDALLFNNDRTVAYLPTYEPESVPGALGRLVVLDAASAQVLATHQYPFDATSFVGRAVVGVDGRHVYQMLESGPGGLLEIDVDTGATRYVGTTGGFSVGDQQPRAIGLWQAPGNRYVAVVSSTLEVLDTVTGEFLGDAHANPKFRVSDGVRFTADGLVVTNDLAVVLATGKAVADSRLPGEVVALSADGQIAVTRAASLDGMQAIISRVDLLTGAVRSVTVTLPVDDWAVVVSDDLSRAEIRENRAFGVGGSTHFVALNLINGTQLGDVVSTLGSQASFIYGADRTRAYQAVNRSDGSTVVLTYDLVSGGVVGAPIALPGELKGGLLLSDDGQLLFATTTVTDNQEPSVTTIVSVVDTATRAV